MTVEQLVKSTLGKETEAFEYEIAGVTRTGWRLYLAEDRNANTDLAAELVEASWRGLDEQGVRLFQGPGVFRIGPDQYAESWGHIEFDPADGPPAVRDPRDSPPACSQIFALPDARVLDIIEFCKVGSHNAQQLPFDDVMNFMNSRMQNLTTEESEMVSPEQREFMRKITENQDLLRHQVSRMPHGAEPWRMVQEALANVMDIAPFAIQFADEAGLRATLLKRVSRPEAKEIGDLILQVNPEAAELAVSDLEELGLTVPMDPQQPGIPDYEGAMAEYIASAGKLRMWWD